MQKIIEKIAGYLENLTSSEGSVEEISRLTGISTTGKLKELLRIITESGLHTDTFKLASCIIELSRSPEPQTAISNYYRFLESATPYRHLISICLEKPVFEILIRIFSSSNYLTNIIIKDPGLIMWLIEGDTLTRTKSYSSYTKELRTQIAPLRDPRRILNSIKRFKAREVLRIAVRDLLGIATLDEVTAELSYLADAIIQIVAELSFREVIQRFAPGIEWIMREESPYSNFAIISLGKLGGHELNYSSDIDLLFISSDPDERKEGEFYTSLAKQILENLTSVSEEGYLYRVDVRLRPDGESGPLVVTTTSHIYYMTNRAHDWEKQALLKARGSAGNTIVISTFMENCRKVLFDPLNPVAPVAQISAMRERAVSSLSPKERQLNIKEMPGGIRDIEFIVQALQIIHGLSKPSILSRNTLESIERLKRGSVLGKGEAKLLQNAYTLYRTIEHRLQLLNNRRTHTLPEDREKLNLLIKRVGYSSIEKKVVEKFPSELATSIKTVESFFNQIFREQKPDIVFYLTLKENRAKDALNRIDKIYNEKLTSLILPFLKSLVFGDFPDLESYQTRQSARRALPIILKEAAKTPDPSITIKNIHQIIKATGATKSMLDIISSDREMMRLLINVSSTSSILSRLLSKNIHTLDMISEGVCIDIEKVRSEKELEKAYTQNILFALINNPPEKWGPSTTGTLISNILDKALIKAFELLDAYSPGLCVFAMGSLGTKEPRFASDLDLLFVSDDESALESDAEAIKRFIEITGTAGLPRIDIRLRPEGEASPPVNTTERFREYLKNRASPWELLAYTRLRYICGNESAGAKFMDEIFKSLKDFKLNDDILNELLRVREKLESLSNTKWSVKHTAGGGYDIEFITSLLFLTSGINSPREKPVPATLKYLARQNGPSWPKGLSMEDVEFLSEAYELYYRIEHGAGLQGFNLSSKSIREEFLSSYFGRLFGMEDGTGGRFGEYLESVEKRVRKIFLRFFKL